MCVAEPLRVGESKDVIKNQESDPKNRRGSHQETMDGMQVSAKLTARRHPANAASKRRPSQSSS